MTEPTKGMIQAWIMEWMLIPGEETTAQQLAHVARRAAAWAREQALEEAERTVRDYDLPIRPSPQGEIEYDAIAHEIPRIAAEVRALKDKK